MQASKTILEDRSTQVRRQTMVDCQIRTFDVTDQRLIARLLGVPRELFVPDEARELAYSDVGLTTAQAAGSRYLLPPFILARLIQGGRVTSRDRVLDIAGGLGYSAAILAGLAGEVVALEETPEMARALGNRLESFGIDTIQVLDGVLSAGAPNAGPFDVILINGTVEAEYERLLAQLAEGGRLLAIVRNSVDPTGRAAKAMCFQKTGGDTGSRYLFDAAAPRLAAFARPAQFLF